MACNWVSNVVLEAPVQPSAAGAAAAGCTAAADRGDAAVALLELAGIGKEAGALDTPAVRRGCRWGNRNCRPGFCILKNLGFC